MQNSQIIKDFPKAIYFSFKEIATYVDKKSGKICKQMIGLPPHAGLKKSFFTKGHKAFAFRTGVDSGISVLDFDILATYHKLVSIFPFLKELYTVKTNKGYHIYFNYDKRLNNSSGVMDDYDGVDIRNDSAGIIILPPTKYSLPDGTETGYTLIGGKVIDFPDELFKLLNHRGVVGGKKPKQLQLNVKPNVNNDNNVNTNKKIFTKEQLFAVINFYVAA